MTNLTVSDDCYFFDNHGSLFVGVIIHIFEYGDLSYANILVTNTDAPPNAKPDIVARELACIGHIENGKMKPWGFFHPDDLDR